MVENIVGLLDRAIPDLCSTEGLAAVPAAELDWLAGRTGAWTGSDPGITCGVRARALVGEEYFGAARRHLTDTTASPIGPQDLVARVWAASRVGPAGTVEALADEVARLPDGFVRDGEVPLCPRSQLDGLLAAARGDLGCAADALRRAAEEGDRRAPVWGALARLELGRVLRASGTDTPDSRRALTSAVTFFVAGGYQHLAARAHTAQQPPAADDVAAPGLGHLVAGARWNLGFGVVPAVEVPETKGLRALAHLVANGHRSVPAVELDRVLAGTSGARLGVLDAMDLDRLLRDTAEPSDLRRLLMDDRVRSRISKLVSRTIAKVADVHPHLGEHLAGTVSTGYLCRYRSVGQVVWRVAPTDSSPQPVAGTHHRR